MFDSNGIWKIPNNRDFFMIKKFLHTNTWWLATSDFASSVPLRVNRSNVVVPFFKRSASRFSVSSYVSTGYIKYNSNLWPTITLHAHWFGFEGCGFPIMFNSSDKSRIKLRPVRYSTVVSN